MASHITQCTRTEVPPASPFEGSIRWVIRAFRGRAQPQVPIDRVGDCLNLSGAFQSLRPNRSVGPDMRLLDFPDNAGLNQFNKAAALSLGMPLIPHLGNHSCFTRYFRQNTSFFDGMSQRFLAINMFSRPHGHDRRMRVGMVRRRDGDGINLAALLIEKLPEILVNAGLREFFECACRIPCIDIAKSHHVFPRAITNVDSTFSACSDGRDVQSTVCSQDVSN